MTWILDVSCDIKLNILHLLTLSLTVQAILRVNLKGNSTNFKIKVCLQVLVSTTAN